MNERMNKARREGGRVGGEVDAWSWWRQGGRQEENSWAGTVSLSADCRLTKHTGHVDGQAHTHTHQNTNKQKPITVQMYRHWGSGRTQQRGGNLSQNLSYMQPINVKMHILSRYTLQNRVRVTCYTKCFYPTLRELTDCTVRCVHKCVCVCEVLVPGFALWLCKR